MKHKKQKVNYEMILCLSIIILTIVSVAYAVEFTYSKKVNVGDFSIDKTNFDNIINSLGDKYRVINICSIKDDNCIQINANR